MDRTLQDFTPDYEKNDKKIYVIIGKFQEGEFDYYKVKIVYSRVVNSNFHFDFGNSESIFNEGVDFGNSLTADFIDKIFYVYSIDREVFEEITEKTRENIERYSNRAYQYEFTDAYTCQVRVEKSNEDLIVMCFNKVVGYIYQFYYELKLQNQNFVVLEY